MATKFHVRSNSLPSGSHPSSTRVEAELAKLKTWESTSTSTSGSIGTGLSLLEDLHICLEDLLNLATTQKVISHHQGEKCMEELLHGAVRVLDICGITRDTMMHIKENVQTLHSSLRRRKGDSSIVKNAVEYNLFSKKMKKNVKKLVKSLKQLERRFGASPLLNQDQELAAVIRVLREAILMNLSVFQSLLTFLAAPTSKSKATKWVAKFIHKGAMSSTENSNELQCVDAAFSTLLKEGADGSKMQAAHDGLEALENAIESLESSMENLFRRLIKTRASLLNAMTRYCVLSSCFLSNPAKNPNFKDSIRIENFGLVKLYVNTIQ